MTEEPTEALTIYRLLEILIAVVTVFGPLVGVMWYVETRLNDLDQRLINNERILTCLLNSSINDVKPTYCAGN